MSRVPDPSSEADPEPQPAPEQALQPAPDPTLDPATAPLQAPAQAIKRRLMHRVADADVSHLTILAEQGDWQPLLPGVQIKRLHQGHGGVLTYLLRLAPGASLPPHRHPVDEECLVLDGMLQVGSGPRLGPGTYHLAHQGALHAVVTAPRGATVFLRGAAPDARLLLD